MDIVEIKDVGSGINFKRRGLTRLIAAMVAGTVDEVVVLDRDRLSRMGWDLLATLADKLKVTLTIASQCDAEISPETAMTQELLAILTVYSCRAQGQRAARNRKARLGH